MEIPIFLHDEKKMMKVEVDKKDVKVPTDIAEELRECAEVTAILDNRMEQIQKKIGKYR